MESLNHTIIQFLELEGTFKGHPVEHPCNEWEHAQLDQAAQGLGCLQGWGINHTSGQPVPVPRHPFPYI